MRRRRLPPARKEMPASLRAFDLGEWAQPGDVELADDFRECAARGRWTAARVAWWRANGVDVVVALREQVAERLARLDGSPMLLSHTASSLTLIRPPDTATAGWAQSPKRGRCGVGTRSR